jgi:flagellar hook-basal body complex protein FliE
MDISAISAIARAGGVAPLAAARGAGAAGVGWPAGAGGFAEALGKALSSVNEVQQRADVLAQRFQLNDPNVSLEETMIAMQTANISFQSLVQVRNRLLSAYHEIMNLQV